MQKLFSMCACHAHPSVRSVPSGARVFVHCLCSCARSFGHCLCILCTLLSLSSCEKAITDDDSVVSGSVADKNANLQVTVFSIEKTPFETFTRTATPASEACTRLNFAVYTLDGSRVKQVNQSSAEADFGKASFQLEPGTYQLVVVGHSASGNPTMTDPTKIKFENADGFTDTYLCYAKVTIGEDKVDYKVSLDRITALCRFVLTDTEIPADVKKMRFYYTGGSGAFDATTGLGCVNSKQDVKFDVSANNKQFDLYTFPYKSTEGTIHLVVTALDASGVEILQREFDVSIEKNYITWVSGSFFGGSSTDPSGGAGITSVTVNTDWAGETHVTF